MNNWSSLAIWYWTYEIIHNLTLTPQQGHIKQEKDNFINTSDVYAPNARAAYSQLKLKKGNFIETSDGYVLSKYWKERANKSINMLKIAYHF